MEDFGRMTLCSRKFSYLLKIYIHILTILSDTDTISSEDGKKREGRVWHEIIDTLRKDSLEVMELTRT